MLSQVGMTGLPQTFMLRCPNEWNQAERAGAFWAGCRLFEAGLALEPTQDAMNPPADNATASPGTTAVITDTLPEASSVEENLRGRQETIVIGDPHVPLHRGDILLHISKKHDGARLVIDGDIFNFDRFSKFQPLNRNVFLNPEHRYSAAECLEMATQLFDSISDYWQDITLIYGNHDIRLHKQIASGAQGDASLADFMLREAFKKNPKITIHEETTYDFYMHKRGDAWIGHWNYYGKPVCAGAKKAADSLMSRVMIDEKGPWKTIIQAHTHHVADARYNGKRVMECGAMCMIPDYIDNSLGKGSEPELGYVQLVQCDGETCDEETHAIRIDTKYYMNRMEIGPYSGRVYY